MLERRWNAWLRPVLTLLAAAGILSLAACGGGSGAPNNPYAPPPTPVTPLAVGPASGTAYAGVPYTLTIDGGVAPYTAVSSNPTVAPVPQLVSGNSVVMLPGAVGTDTAVTVTIRDSLLPAQTANAAILVRPALLLPNAITITGSPGCTSGGQLCSGSTGTAQVKVTGPAGAGLANRQVRFEVVQGQYSIVSNNPAQPLVQTLTVVTDVNGNAIVGLSVPPNVPSQLGVLRAIEVASGMQVTGQFTISQQITGTNIVSVIPTGKTTIEGPDKTRCSAGVRVSYYIFGGSPPYRISLNFPDAASLVNPVVSTQGGSFDIVTNGSCFVGLTPIIVDANGLTVTNAPTVDNKVGTTDPVVTVPLVVQPASFGSLAAPVNCTGATFAFTVTGNAPFSAAASKPVVFATNPVTVSPGTLSVSSVPPGGPTTITVGDGKTPQQLATAQIYCL